MYLPFIFKRLWTLICLRSLAKVSIRYRNYWYSNFRINNYDQKVCIFKFAVSRRIPDTFSEFFKETVMLVIFSNKKWWHFVLDVPTNESIQCAIVGGMWNILELDSMNFKWYGNVKGRCQICRLGSDWQSTKPSSWKMSCFEWTTWNWSRFPVKGHYWWWDMVLWLRHRNKAIFKLIEDVIVSRLKNVVKSKQIMLIGLMDVRRIVRSQFVLRGKPFIFSFGSFRKSVCQWRPDLWPVNWFFQHAKASSSFWSTMAWSAASFT